MPVAVNLYKIREDKGAGGELFRSVQRQKPQYQGIWIVSPEGKVLAAHQEIKSYATWTQEVLETIEGGRSAFGAITPRAVAESNPLPHRGAGALADGSVNLALTTRTVRGGGKEQAPAAVNPESLWLWDGPVRSDGPPVIDSISLSAAEWALLFPPKLPAMRVGETWKLPEAVARKFSRALSPSSDQSTMPRPEEALVAELTATVESVEGESVRIRLAGRWETKHIYLDKPSYSWATAKGTAVYDRARKSPRSLLMTFAGAYRMAPPYDKSDRPIGGVVEWER